MNDREELLRRYGLILAMRGLRQRRAVFRRCEAILGDFFVRYGVPEDGDDDARAIGDDSGAEC